MIVKSEVRKEIGTHIRGALCGPYRTVSNACSQLGLDRRRISKICEGDLDLLRAQDMRAISPYLDKTWRDKLADYLLP